MKYTTLYTRSFLHNRPFSEDVRQWMPVDMYIGGIEHGESSVKC